MVIGHVSTINHLTHVLPAVIVVVFTSWSTVWHFHGHAAFAYQPGMKTHHTTPISIGRVVTIVARTILFLGVQIVPVDIIVVWVGSPFSDQILAQWSWPFLASVVCLPRWLCSTGLRQCAPIKKKGSTLVGAQSCYLHENKRASDRGKSPFSTLCC